MIFDTHAHVLSADTGRYPHSMLRGGTRPPVPPMVFPVERLVEAMDREGVDRACLVQRATLYGYDNSYALDSVARYPERFRSVAVLDAQDPAAPATLAAVCRFTDEVVLDLSPSDATLAALRALVSDQVVVNLVLTAGCYMTVARLIATTGIEPDATPLEHLTTGPTA